MDELIRWSLEEIALDGLLGCSPPDLYQILESEHKAVLDGFKKKKLFEWLLAKSGKGLTFYERQKDRPKPKDEKKKTKMLQTKALDDVCFCIDRLTNRNMYLQNWAIQNTQNQQITLMTSII